MAAAPSTVALPGIAALPPTTARQIGSGQVLVDASSVVKELIDNALDARAKSIFVDIAANTIDTIQVKDDGHGIPSEDQPLVCRRYCTSKIRDLSDLRDVGGRWLGFRGEALSSMAEMSGALVVTTRVEGEPVAVKLKYGRDGELASTERDSHPVGTTVKLTGFFEYIPVRKQTAVKNAAKCLMKIRRLIQAYVLARPGIRFRLRVLKAKNNAGDFVYAPKAEASVEDAVLKMFGKDCAMQCGLVTVEADGFEICAFLPRPTAVGSKISNYGSFVSVDARPVSSNRGTVKQLIRACKDRLCKVNPSLGGVRDPFFCININCPLGSYDANVEPAKDEVLFENSDDLLSVLDRLLKSYYPEVVANIDNDELSLSAARNREPESDKVLAPDEDSALPQENNATYQDEATDSTSQPRWRSSMYGIDEDDLEFLQDDRAPIIDEEEGRRAIEVSNPWTIARMNAAIKPRKSASNGQLPSPAKSIRDGNAYSSPSRALGTPSRIAPVEPLTPQTLSKTNTLRSPLDDELERSIRRLPQPVSAAESVNDWVEERRRDLVSNDRSSRSQEIELRGTVSLSSPQSDWASSSVRDGNMGLELATPAHRTTHHQHSIQDPTLSKPAARQKRVMNPKLPYFEAGTSSKPRQSLQRATGRTGENRLYSNNNKDIRDCFRQRSEVRGNNIAQERSFTPINRPAQWVQSKSLGLLAPVDRSRPPQSEQDRLQADSAEPRNMREYLQTYSERAGARPSPPGGQLSMQFERRSATTRHFPAHKADSATSAASHTSSLEPERSSLPFPQSNTLPATRNTLGSNQRSQSTDEINAFFQSHLENASSRHLPRTAAPLQKARPTVAQETSASANPSARPKKLVLSLSATLAAEAITRHALARHDHLPKWDCAAHDAYYSFNEHIPEERIAVWVCRVDSLLCALYERVGEMRETRGVLGESVRRALRGVDVGYGGREGEGLTECGEVDDDVVANDDGNEDDDIEEEMLMDL